MNILKHTQAYKGGGSGNPQTTVTSTPPPPTAQSVEVQMAQRDAAKQAAKKRGMSQTILAGETGGVRPAGPTVMGQSAQAPGQQKRNVVLGGG